MHRPLIHLVCALLVLGAVALLYGFGYSLVAKERTQADALATEVALASARADRLLVAQSSFKSLADDEALIRGHFVGAEEIVPFLETLEGTGRALGSSVEVAAVSPEGDTALKLSLRITGSFDSVLRTLGAIEYAPYASTLTSVTFDTPPTESARRSWSATAVFLVGTKP